MVHLLAQAVQVEDVAGKVAADEAEPRDDRSSFEQLPGEGSLAASGKQLLIAAKGSHVPERKLPSSAGLVGPPTSNDSVERCLCGDGDLTEYYPEGDEQRNPKQDARNRPVAHVLLLGARESRSGGRHANTLDLVNEGHPRGVAAFDGALLGSREDDGRDVRQTENKSATAAAGRGEAVNETTRASETA